MILKDKNILLAVTGSIAIYKSLELIRLFIKAGANVKVILSSLERFTQSEIGKEYITDLKEKKNITIIKGVTLSEGNCKECNK